MAFLLRDSAQQDQEQRVLVPGQSLCGIPDNNELDRMLLCVMLASLSVANDSQKKMALACILCLHIMQVYANCGLHHSLELVLLI